MIAVAFATSSSWPELLALISVAAVLFVLAPQAVTRDRRVRVVAILLLAVLALAHPALAVPTKICDWAWWAWECWFY